MPITPPDTSADRPSDLRELLAPLWARKFLIAFVVILTTTGVYFYYSSKPKTYAASTQLLLEPAQIDALIGGTANAPTSDRTAQNLAELATTRGVAAIAAGELPDNRSVEALLGAVSVSAESGSDFLTLTATDATPARAAQTADAYAKAFVTSRSAIFRTRLQQASREARRQLRTLPVKDSPAAVVLQERIARLAPLLVNTTADLRQVDPAEATSKPVAPKPARNAIFGFGISLVLAMFAAFGMARFDVRVRRVSEVEDIYSLPVLAAIPHFDAGLARNGSSGGAPGVPPVAEEPLRSLQTAIRLSVIDTPLKTILVTSAVPGEGKSTLVRNLAMVQRDAGEHVIVVEADLRRPVLGEWFRLPQREGLTDVLAGNVTWEEALQTVEAAQIVPSNGGKPKRSATIETLVPTGRLNVLVSGPTPPDPSAILASGQTSALLADLASHANYVLIDAPPVLPVSDALSLLAAVDGVIVVSRIGSTQRAAAKRLMEILNRASATNVLGVVANDAPADDVFGGYGYSYSYMTTTNGGPRA